MAREVIDPEGVRWTIRRRWTSWDSDGPLTWWDYWWPVDFALDWSLFGLATAVVYLVFAALFAFVVVPLAFLLLEVIGFAVLVAGGLFGRVLLRRPWRIDADADAHGPATRFTWEISGWRAGHDAIDAIAAGLRTGERPPRGRGLPAAQTR